LKLRITPPTWSSLVNATFAIADTSIPLRRQQHHLRPRQVTTDPLHSACQMISPGAYEQTLAAREGAA
jgi:hypothetical protein